MQRIAARELRTRALLAEADALILLVAGLAAAWLRFGSTGFEPELEQILRHPGFIIYAVVVQFGLATTFDLYRPSSWRTLDYLLARTAALAVAMALALVVGVYLVEPWRFGRGLLALTLALSIPTQAVVRAVWLRVASWPLARSAVVIGDGPIVGALRAELDARPSPPFRIDRHLPAPINGNGDPLADLDPTQTELIIVAQLGDGDPTIDRLAELNFKGTTVVDAAGAYAALTGRIPVRQVDSRWFIATGDFSSIASSPFHHLQRFLDLVAASVLLVLTAPVLVAAAVAVLLGDGPPVIYRQRRLGRYGEPFELLKLRTMKRGSDANGPTFAEANDDRVFGIGRLLRRWRIDELPQLVNILRGEMSLVGPRPERPDVAARFERKIPFYAFRYSVRPGLTGWAQVNLPYCSRTEDHQAKLEFDLYAVRHHGPAMYAIVLLRTLGAIVFRPGR
ncbi:MAG: sugar transferase [Thermoanaerobaculales bacterium]|jgi:lipopolysaccharide/colanic/teichoic acid biosynthesis glycosyltransferase|nr:sugar transferase [Thermoanaerobaculales bacterium]